MKPVELTGWDRLRHGGLLLDAQRQRELITHQPQPLLSYHERELRRWVGQILDDGADIPDFITFVLQRICGFTDTTGSWQRGSSVSSDWSRPDVTGEIVKPRQLWRGHNGGCLPIFIDREKRVGIGRGRKAASQVLQWLRAGPEQLALLTNGRQWRLIFAGLDFDAWCEWDIDLWFEEGEISDQVTILRTLISPTLWKPAEKETNSPLLQAILDSRKGQAELSQFLGERVRESVEVLIRGHSEALKRDCSDVETADIYRAAVRMIMRMVVVLFAESRDLLPRDNALYFESYGLAGLLEELEKVNTRGGNRLARSTSAWPRVLALFRLVYDGSHHPELPVPLYGGELFAPGKADAQSGLSRTLAVFENACFDDESMTDRNVYQILEHITRTRVKIRQGRSSTLITAPVDFTDLSSEYIGILYEGLLDFELKTAPPNDPVIFLAIGDQPALPLSRLEQMEDKDLKDLLEKMKDKSSADGESEDEEAEEAADEEETPESEDEVADEETEEELIEDIEEEEPEAEDERHATRTRAETWARRAVIAGKLVRKPRGTLTPEKTLLFEDMIGRKARQLVIRVILPGEWFLVRWGGTRKGAGTFYTRPGLAVPTVQRTLRPLAWEAPVDTKGKPDPKAPAADWTPKKPEEILNLKVCDPACGSGTFPVAALRFLTDSLYKSVHHHKRIREKGNDSVVSLLGIAPSSTSSELALGQEQLGCRPDDERFELSLKAVLRRHVVERCIYGVDLDPLAVELCRLALWIETMDRTLPFSFLDHKIKRGNALVGAWFDQFQHYPAMAWKNRDGGDKGHTNGVHFKKDERTKAIKAFVKDKLQGDLAATIMAQLGQRRLGEKEFVDPVHVHKEALDILSRLHDLPVQDSAERARIYREELLGSEAYRSLKSAMNRWCACWFWPANKLDDAPLPSTLADPSQRTREIADRMAAEKGFFHWELEFPDVFFEEGSGFDAMLGNPPWENLQPNPEEYFSNYDPLFRTYGNLVKRECRNSMYEKHREIEVRWLDFCADFRSFSHWVTHAANPFGDPSSDCGGGIFPLGHGGKEIHNRWRKIRAKSKSYAQSNHIFRYQMGRIFTYKLFLEQCHALLRDGGRLGQIIPSGLYSDAWSKPLRELFLDHCRWEWLFGFENRAKLFDIDSRFKFNPVIIEKGGKTAAIRTAFMRRNLEDWERAENFVTDYSRAQVDQFSPRSKAILEIQSARDLEILEKIYSNSVLLGDDGPDGWGIKYKLEFMMNTDAHLFPPRPKWEAQGYRPDEYSRWLKGDWRPIGELWAELGVDPTKPVPVEIELEDWLFDTTAGPERRTAEAQFVHGHLLKPGDVARTQWRVRCAQPPYDSLPIPRADIPEGIILSREADAWIHEDRIEDTALPLYEGRLFSAYDFAAKAWISGSGLSARWNQVDWSHKLVNPQYLASLEDVNTHPRVITSPKVSYRNIARNTDTRSMIATVICGDPTPHMTSNLVLLESSHAWALCASLNSFVADFAVRQRLTGTHIDQHLATELPVLPIKWSHHLSKFALSLAAGNQKFAPALLKWSSSLTSWKSCWALTQSNRLAHLSSLDAIAFAAFGFNDADVQHILKDCDSPVSYHSSVRSPDLSARGFWRIDRDKIPAHRHTVLSIVAFYFLEQLIESKGGDLESGIAAYCNQNGGDGWLLPETLRLSDYGLGEEPWSQDDQSVAKQLGQRFYDWQLVQGIEESWDECHLHARNVLGKWNYEKVCEGKKNGTKSFCKVAPKYSQYGSEYFTSFGQMRLNYENKDEN